MAVICPLGTFQEMIVGAIRGSFQFHGETKDQEDSQKESGSKGFHFSCFLSCASLRIFAPRS